MSYNRKLEIGHWNQGKGCKGTRKAKMRAFTEAEIREQIAADEDENYRTKHVSRGNPNYEARLRHQIEYYEQRVAEHERQAKTNKDHWSCAWTSYARDALRKARQELKELLEKKNAVRS